MKKICNVCGLRNPAAAQNCVTCNAPLPAGGGLPAGARCCPAPGCVELAVPPPARYCPLCGTELKPVSAELWEGKFIEPALAKNFVAALQGSSELLRGAAEMGVPPDEAERRLDLAFTRRAGVTRGVLQEWMREHIVPLGETGDNSAAARSEALAQAEELNIERSHAELILRTIASEHASSTGTPATETSARHPAGGTPPADAPPDKGATPRPPDAETSGPAESVAASIIAPKRPRRVVPESEHPTATGEPRGERIRLTTLHPAGGEKEKEDPAPPSTKRPPPVRAALGCGLVALCVGLGMFIWLASRLAGTNSTRDRPQGDVAGNVSSAQADAQPGELPAADTTPAAEAAASPEVTPGGDLSNSNTELLAEQAAVLILFTNADNVTVRVNGRQQGVISKGRPVSFRLSPGDQSISATSQGFEQYQEHLHLKAGEKRTLFVSLRAQQTPAAASRELARQRLHAALALSQRQSYRAAIEQVNEGLRLDPGNQELLSLREDIRRAVAESERPRNTNVQRQPSRERVYESPPVIQEPARPRQQPVVADRYEAPRMTRKSELIYPRTARATNIWGEVQVEVILDEGGRVVDARAVSGPKLLQRAAVEAATRSGYSPARRNGQPVGSTLRINYVFKIH